MKRFIALILSLMLLFSFTACSLQDVGQSIGEQKNKAVTRGVIDGHVFTSEYAEITFTKPEAWVFADDEEIAELMNSTADVLQRDAFEQAAATMVSVYDMMATDPTTGINISVAYENLKLSSNTNITEEAYFDVFDKQYSNQTGFSVTIGERQPVTLGQQTYFRADYQVEYSGMTMCQYMYIRKLENYMHVISVTVFDQESIQDIEAMFS